MDSNMGSHIRIPMLSAENYDTWKLRVQAVMTKNKTWVYVNGKKPMPETDGSSEQVAKLEIWKEEDDKAKADLYLSVNDSELKQIKNCETAREIWLKLETIFESKGPSRKASLWKQLSSHRLGENGDVQHHVDSFFDMVNKLSELSIEVSKELQSIMLLHSLPESFENFRCAIETRDELPNPETLKIKILDEDRTRKGRHQDNDHEAMLAKKVWKMLGKEKVEGRMANKENSERDDRYFKYKCHRCRKVGHKAVDCNEKQENVSVAENITFFGSISDDVSYRAELIQNRDKWCLDSGCTTHLCRSEECFEELANTKNTKLNLASDASTEVKAKGSIRIIGTDGRVARNVELENVLHVPELRGNLLSVAKITDANNKVIFTREGARIENQYGTSILTAERIGNLYYLREAEEHRACVTLKEERKSPMTVWHERFGHLNRDDLVEMERRKAVLDLQLGSDKTLSSCETCVKAKLTGIPFQGKFQRSSDVLEIIHADLCGPIRPESKGKARYFATFIDDHSRWTEVRFLRRKDEVFQAFKDFKNLVERQTGKKIKSLQSDNGGEFRNKRFNDFLKDEGITRRLTTPYTPQLNGVAERKNRTLVEMARCLLTQSGLSPSFWAEAIATSNHIRNRCITAVLNGRTPFELWYGKRAHVNHLRIFGETVFALDKTPGKGKLDARGIKCIFTGYDDSSKGYRLWVPSEQKVIISRDVKFMNIFKLDEMPHNSPSANERKHNRNKQNAQNNVDKPMSTEFHIDLEPEENSEEVPKGNPNRKLEEINSPHEEEATRRGPGRPRKIYTGLPGRPRKQSPMRKSRNDVRDLNEENVNPVTDREDQSEDLEQEEDFANLAEITWKQALNGPDAEEWKNAIVEEIDSLIRHDTWYITDRPKDRNVVGCRTVLRNKYNAQGAIERRKARVVAKGFTQKPGIDYHDTFAPVARLSSVRLLLALAVKFDLKVYQMDITTAYLNGTIEEEIYMELPESLTESLSTIVSRRGDRDLVGNRARKMLRRLKEGDKVCRLQKALYGLKQAGNRWNERFDQKLRSMGLKPTAADPCVYFTVREGDIFLVLIYVDDILIAYRNEEDLNSIREQLLQDFEVKDLGEISYCLGIEVSRETDRITMSQSGYVRDLIRKFGMEESKPISTPVAQGEKLIKSEEGSNEESQEKPYRELIGGLNYLAVATRPDISYIVSYLSQFCSCHEMQHWKAAKRVLRYLKATMDFGIVYKKDSKYLHGFVDADWGACSVDRKSYTGLAFILSGAVVSWESKKQRTVALSSTEAEYMGLSEAAKEALYLRRFITEVGFRDPHKTVIACDNRGALCLTKNHTFHARSKHIDVRHHFVRDVLKEGHIELVHMSTEDMPADILTKGLPREKHYHCMKLLGIQSTANCA